MKRREFVKGAAALTLTAMLPVSLLAKKKNMKIPNTASIPSSWSGSATTTTSAIATTRRHDLHFPDGYSIKIDKLFIELLNTGELLLVTNGNYENIFKIVDINYDEEYVILSDDIHPFSQS